ncbi:MAG: hypothetical protein GQ531_11350 [Sulfurovum sp.]|nr:hypothetical protein [Sulfurovum sp.]
MIYTIEKILNNSKILEPIKDLNLYQNFKFIEQQHLEYILILLKEIIPKTANLITNPKKQNNWKNHLNFILPLKNLNYNSEEEYLAIHNIEIHDVIQNSISQIFPDMNKEDILELTSKLILLMEGHKIRVLKENNVAVYLEIMHLMGYINNINKLIMRYKKPYSNYNGTAHRSSSLKDIVNKQIRVLEERLDGAYFRIQNEDELEQTEYAIKILKTSLIPEHKNIIEQLNFGKILFGFDMKLFDANKNEQIALEQTTNFYNGSRTKPHELVRSVMIYIDEHFNKSTLDTKEKAEIILFISRFFYKQELEEAEKGKNTLAYNKKHIGKEHRVKTILHDIPIYAYQYKSGIDFLTELTELGFSGMMGLKNIVEPDKPTLEEASAFYIGRNIVEVRKVFDLTKKQLKAILYINSKEQAKQEQNKLLDISSQT